MFSIDHIDHIVINTEDTERCVDFYTTVLGFHLDAGNNRIALKSGMQKINVHPVGEIFHPIARNPTIGRIAFGLHPAIDHADLDQYRIENQDDANRSDKGFLMADPDGNIIRIEKNNCGTGMVICDICLAVTDIKASISFYKTFAGMAKSGTSPATLSFKHGHLVLTPKISGSISRGSGDFCLPANGDIEEIHATLAKSGAPFDSDEGIVSRHGATGPIRSIYLRDPDGNLVEISTRQSGA